MTVEELVPLTNGLSVAAGPHTLVCDRARVIPVEQNAVDIAFRIAGTDLVPRFRLTRAQVAAGEPDEIARIVRHVVQHAVTGWCAQAR